MKTITFETYADMFLDNCIENRNYDNEARVFEVPEDWAIEWVETVCKMSLEEFLNEYTYDESWNMYEDASKVLLSSEIVGKNQWDSLKDAIESAKDCGDWSVVDHEPTSVNIEFYNTRGRWDRTQLDLYDADKEQELTTLWNSLKDEMEALHVLRVEALGGIA